MTTEQKFNCIFCKDVFDTKEELQVHFRKHADPRFNSKNRFQNDQQASSEKIKEKSDMVSCDVCSQMFPTISKAITHKHKVHPDHDAKYFCPWCGKLFTMKHPYNIHIQTSHDKQEQIEDKIFHCDCCDVEFFLPTAMMYHNRFFHRQDTDIPDVGTSKKMRLYNQEAISLYYCAFCGDEYENKVNLFKHMTDDHGDENQCPEEVLRCPLCEAIFYHLDAYEIHLSFHTTEDLYSAQNELFAELLDFSLETVPPMIEKVESREDLGDIHSQDTDAESNALGIDQFLQLAMDQAEDTNTVKVKKKKHKKSKKSAITLDEFLSMNKDVFGEGLDFQGVEEVPTRVVKKQFKNSKKASVAAAAELEKLKEKGIVVMKVATKPTRTNQKKTTGKVTKANPNRELKTSSEVLTKLMNQSNNQIKIVKKSTLTGAQNDTGQMNTDEPKADSSNDTLCKKNESLIANECKEDAEKNNEDETPSTCTNLQNPPDDNVVNKDLPLPETEQHSMTLTAPDKTADIPDNKKSIEIDGKRQTDKDDQDTDVNMRTEPSRILSNNVLSEQLSGVTVPSISPNISHKIDESLTATVDKQVNSDPSDHEESDSEMVDKNDKALSEDVKRKDEHEFHMSNDNNSDHFDKHPVVNSLSTLKHLSHLTVKPISHGKTTSNEPQNDNNKNISEIKCDERPQVKNEKEALHLNVASNIDKSPTKLKPVIDKDPTLDALKILSKNITIKSLNTSTKRSMDESQSEENDEHDTTFEKTTSSIKLKDVSGNKNLTIKKIKVESNEPALGKKVVDSLNNPIKTVQSAKPLNKVVTQAPNIKVCKMGTDNSLNNSNKSNTNILKRLPNITTKPLTPKVIVQTQIINQTNNTLKTVETPHRKEDEIIEISDIDDTDDETDGVTPEPAVNTKKSDDPLKNLSKHITVKSLNQFEQSIPLNIKVEKEEVTNEYDERNNAYNSDDDIPIDTKVCNQKLSNKSMAFKNALKNLGKNITVKSRTSSPCQPPISQDHYSQDSNLDKLDPASDSDSDTGKVKITEIEEYENDNDKNADDCDDEEGDNNPIVESPHDSGSDNDEFDEMDFETEIKATTLQKTNQEITTNKNTICLNNLKNISKSITIKSLNSNTTGKSEKTNINKSQESTEVAKYQTNNLPIKPKQVVKEAPNNNTLINKSFKNPDKAVDNSSTSKEAINQKVSVNKEVTVKTFQTKTVIQEITTTVTKTIKTVNQTVKQETKNSRQMNIPVLPQKVLGMKPSMSKNLQGVVIRHATPSAVKPSNTVAQIRPANNVVRPCKQITTMRPSLNKPRQTTPRMPTVKTNTPKSNTNRQVIGKPLKFSPSALTSTTVKKPISEEASGPFSCFKKPKESLIPVSDIPSFGGGNDSTVQINATAHTSTSNYSSTSKVIKGNSVVTATQMKSEVSSMQQLTRLSNNTVGIKIKGTQVKQSQVQEKSEPNAMKRTTLEAIEKLQKQGLLVKKPRIENSDSDHADDNAGYSSTEEQDE